MHYPNSNSEPENHGENEPRDFPQNDSEEQHLPHEAWHVVQERRPRRMPTPGEEDAEENESN